MATAVESTAKTVFYRPELDALRFFAFFCVFLLHTLPRYSSEYASYGVPHLVAVFATAVAGAGAFGVPLFFLLSAYLITYLLLREKDTTGDVDLRSFYIRRILRIWPLYFFMLALASWWPIKNARLPVNYLLGYLLLAGNWVTVKLGPPQDFVFVSILWSVSIEEQFYLLWPLATKKLRRTGLIVTAIALIVLANSVRCYLFLTDAPAGKVWPNTFVQVDSIALGILAAIFLTSAIRVPRAIFFCCGVLLWLTCGHFNIPTASPYFTLFAYPFISLGALTIFLAVYGLQVRNKVLPYLGKISYGLYVYHFFALYLVGLLLHGRAGTPLRLAVHFFGSLGLTIILAAASYCWLESPFLRLKERFTFVRSRPV